MHWHVMDYACYGWCLLFLLNCCLAIPASDLRFEGIYHLKICERNNNTSIAYFVSESGEQNNMITEQKVNSCATEVRTTEITNNVFSTIHAYTDGYS